MAFCTDPAPETVPGTRLQLAGRQGTPTSGPKRRPPTPAGFSQPHREPGLLLTAGVHQSPAPA
ncbi:hypothetical protein Dda_7544 [Drechslerella dactyloides]|uniref:Uncharacterized protein n=1 Tax=Drechslerella dactyloides TaxID=74499 RepID=A0AAD6NGT6_DREDA|nr:hypothetical protein Dda_7544 [Drechslerella dactyloides]